MAKAATKKTTKTSKTAKPKKAAARKPLRAAAAKPAKTAQVPAGKKPATKAVVSAKKIPAARAPVISKEELRSQIEKLAAANATLRTKNREAAKALKAAEARIAVLEHQISQSEAKAASEEKPGGQAKSSRKMRAPKVAAQPALEADSHEEAGAPPAAETI